MELTELLLTMAGEQNVQTVAIRLLHSALEKWPDVVLLALFQIPVSSVCVLLRDNLLKSPFFLVRSFSFLDFQRFH